MKRLLRTGLQANMEATATKFPTYAEHPEPLVYELPFSAADIIGFRRRWSLAGRPVNQKDLGDLLGLSLRQINRYETGANGVNRVFVLALNYIEERLCESRARAVAGAYMRWEPALEAAADTPDDA